MGSFAAEMRALMSERGISGNALARQVYVDPALISRYRSGKQKPSATMAGRIDKALTAGGKLAGLASTEAGPDRRSVLAGGLMAGAWLGISAEAADRLDWVARHPPAADGTAVDSIADVLAGQRRAEDALGSAAMLRPALAQLSLVDDLVKQARGPVRPQLVHVAQQCAQFAGWLCRDVGHVAGARSCCGQALEWAAELGDQTMMATVLTERSYMAAEAGEVGSMIGLAQGAQRDTAAAAGQRALAAGLEARGYAMAGDSAAVERKMGEAQDLAGALADRPQDQRPWSYWMKPAFFRHEAGITCGYLAGTAPRWHESAAQMLAAAPETGSTPLWSGAANLTWLAFAHTRAGAVDQACATVLEASRAAHLAGSARHAATLSQISSNLQARFPDDPRVAELAGALR